MEGGGLRGLRPLTHPTSAGTKPLSSGATRSAAMTSASAVGLRSFRNRSKVGGTTSGSTWRSGTPGRRRLPPPPRTRVGARSMRALAEISGLIGRVTPADAKVRPARAAIVALGRNTPAAADAKETFTESAIETLRRSVEVNETVARAKIWRLMSWYALSWNAVSWNAPRLVDPTETLIASLAAGVSVVVPASAIDLEPARFGAKDAVAVPLSDSAAASARLSWNAPDWNALSWNAPGAGGDQAVRFQKNVQSESDKAQRSH